LKLALNVHELARSNKSLRWLWNNQNNGGERIMAKLNKIYIANYHTQGHVSKNYQYIVKEGGDRSCHHLISCVLEVIYILD
jgi:hypothetical protein